MPVCWFTVGSEVLTLAVRVQRVFGIVVCCVVTTVAARSQEMLGRNYSASLGVTALAHRMQLDAEKRGLSAQKDREAAQAQATAFQNVMRYVCHELRNPLHGIMVGSPRQRISPNLHLADVALYGFVAGIA